MHALLYLLYFVVLVVVSYWCIMVINIANCFELYYGIIFFLILLSFGILCNRWL